MHQLTPIRQPENFISNLKRPPGIVMETLNSPRELNTKNLASLRRDGVFAFPLQQVHAVEAEIFHFHKRLARL